MPPKHHGEAGFTVVEIAVVIGVITILAALAAPQYQKYRNRSRQTEAKLALGTIYIFERQFITDQGSFTLCLREAGYVPEASATAARYYAEGFYPGGGNVCGKDGTRVCNGFQYAQQAAAPAASLAVNDTICAVGMGNPLTTTISTAYGANVKGNSTLAIPMVTADQAASFPGAAGVCGVTQTTFLACATGALDTAVYDQWSIDQDQQIVNMQSGI
jgi:type II secretory pathway pseudopilin PulG